MDESNQSPESRRRSAATQNRTAIASTPAVRTNEQSAQPDRRRRWERHTVKCGADATRKQRKRERNGHRHCRPRARTGRCSACDAERHGDRRHRHDRPRGQSARRKSSGNSSTTRWPTMSTGLPISSSACPQASRTRISASCSATLKVWRAASRRCLSDSAFAIGLLGARFLKSSSPDRGASTTGMAAGRSGRGRLADKSRVSPAAESAIRSAGGKHERRGPHVNARRRAIELHRAVSESSPSPRQRDVDPAAENL